MTQREAALAGRITPEMERAAAREGVTPEALRAGLASGTICLPANPAHTSLDPLAVGKGLRTKVNANIGTSADFPETGKEIAKLKLAVAAGADAVMDLSTGCAADIDRSRKAVLQAAPVPVGTVPIYQAAVEAQEKYGAIVAMTAEDIFQVIERQAEDGVDFMTVHCGVTRESIGRLQREGRAADIVSRGGAFLTGWMLHHGKENPLYEQYDRLLAIARAHDVTLSLGDGLRPGCLADATDRAQIQELIILGELVERAWEAGVQVMVEGPGHVPFNRIRANMELEKRLCHGAPFYVLGPLVTDVAPGYDHITAAIGGTMAAVAGADFLCYVTPAEHLGLPTDQDVREGVVAARIAAHAADLAKGVPGAWEWDLKMARARKALDWEAQIALAIDPEKARRYRQDRNPAGKTECTMCGKYCAMRLVGEYLGKDLESCQ
ncbi:phosphomethylpyrimidine synthase ThiC [Gelria sp. Kuro-4]|uniref:phosphomethylpyrimidine synthase ThiC n=1 Tax=Gelria sp. Kuro-4 TaxID=2796927 RepID=UPI001BF17A91|nr:phosphomethylpyrimidine synthase ThiC [Gelria sp. Kuro-4]BCV24200.1 phosphomethylpyrimidine synthase 1 [Gelria sp. Kuro-4]